MSHRPPLFSDIYPDYDAWSQLRSVHELIDTVFTWRNSLHGEISESEQDWERSSGDWAELAAEAMTIALYHASVYRDAAAVQSAVGVLAPFVEGFLAHAFVYLGCLHGDAGAPTKHPRWKHATDVFWNPRKPNGLIQGLRELREALDLDEWLTDERLKTLDLLFTFRNRSLHFAYEWPPVEIEKFERLVGERGWSDDVAWAKSGGKPWIAYLKDGYLERALTTSTGIVKGFVVVAKARGGVFRADPGAFLGFGPAEEH